MIQMLKGSKVNHAWLQQVCAANPPQQIRTPEGVPVENSFLTGPVRLSFVNLLEMRRPKALSGQTSAPLPYYTATCLFPPGVHLGVLEEEWKRRCREDFPKNVTSDGQIYGLYPTFADQGQKPHLEGYTPGGIVVEMRANEDHRPQVLDSRMNPIVDKSRVYSGVWAICAGRFYAIGKNSNDPTTKKGIRFGLTSAMIIADDEKIAGSTANPQQQFAGVSITQDTNVAAEFAQGGGQAAVGAYIPSSQPTMAVTPNAAHPLAAQAAAMGLDVETYVMMYGNG